MTSFGRWCSLISGDSIWYYLRTSRKMRANNGEYRRSLFQAFLEDDDMFVRNVAQKIMDFTKDASNRTLVQFLNHFWNHLVIEVSALSQEDKIERLSILNSFFWRDKNICYPSSRKYFKRFYWLYCGFRSLLTLSHDSTHSHGSRCSWAHDCTW